MLSFLKNRKEISISLKNTVVISSKTLDLLDISKIFDFMNNIGSGSSVVPVIVVHTLLNIVQPYLWKEITIKALKEHTSSDTHSKSYGDVEGIDNNSNTIIAIEVKHKIVINESIIMIFDKKTCEEYIPLKYIITTANVTGKVVKNNICVDTLTSFVVSYLQQVLFYEKNICLIFVKELRNRIVSYKNIGTSVKEAINEYITQLLVSPSP